MAKDDEIQVDFSKIKGFFKNRKKDPKPSDDEDISVDMHKVGGFLKTYGFLLLLLIPIFLSIYMRAFPLYLPITDEWSENTVINYYRAEISRQISLQYPNLPDANKQALIDDEMRKFLEANGDMVQGQIAETSVLFKQGLQDEKGYTYMPDIDPYFWYAHSNNYLKYGKFEDQEIEGKSVFSLRNGRLGRSFGEDNLNAYAGAYLYKFISIFNSNITLMRAYFYLPVIIITLSVIPAFFIGRMIAGNVGGLVAGVIVAVNNALLGRSLAGHADTDMYNIFFPLMILWMVLLALDTKSLKNRIIYAGAAALLIGLFSKAWTGWWFVFNFIIAAAGLYLIYLGIRYVFSATRKQKFQLTGSVKDLFISLGSFISGSMLFVLLFRGFNDFMIFLRGPFDVITLKDVAIAKVWPNVLTTVAEFNEVPLATIIPQMGGKLLFLLAIAGIIWLALRGKTELFAALVLVIWMAGTAYGFTKGIRFAILMVPGFALALGAFLGLTYSKLSEWLNKELNVNSIASRAVIFLIICYLMLGPINGAYAIGKNDVPYFDDAWYNTLAAINQSSSDAIITSWWDFGHWFYAVSERRVTFDGADQGERIHWVGKSLLTRDEHRSAGILRMLNCGQEKAPHAIEKYNGGNTVKAIAILEDIVMLERDDAIRYLKDAGFTDPQVAEIIETTHCTDLIDNYYITSADMIGKSGVWAHFGSWDFEKATIYQAVSKTKEAEGTKILMETFGKSEDDASLLYYEIQNRDADQWVAPWPSYASGLESCSLKDKIYVCGNGLYYDPAAKDAYFSDGVNKLYPKTLVWAEIDGLYTKEYSQNILNQNNGRNLSVAMIPLKNGGMQSVIMDTDLDSSVFTRLYFYQGHGSRYFERFNYQRGVTGVDIYTWKVRWEPGEQIIMDAFIPPDQIRASHIIVNSSEEAEEIVGLLQEGEDFAELAEERSFDGSASRGGDLGWFSKGMMVPDFENAAFALKDIGEVSGVVKSQFGYHVIMLTGKMNGEEAAREELRKKLSEDKE